MDLTESELNDLRQMLGNIGLSENKQDEMIRVLDNIAKSWADQAHGMSSIQLSLSARANYRFSGIEAHAMVTASSTINASTLVENSTTDSIDPKERVTP